VKVALLLVRKHVLTSVMSGLKFALTVSQHVL
jgi:hypothetical protein